MMKFFFIVPFFLISLTSCFSMGGKDETSQAESDSIGNVKLNYYSNKTVTSLTIPPDLTSPNQEKAFKLSEFVSGVQENYISFTDSDNQVKEAQSILRIPANIDVVKSGQRRWLIVDKKTNNVWELARSFLKQQGFAIKSINKEVGIIETDYLENKLDVPDQSVGLIRSMIRKATGQSYALPTIDKYRIRIEPLEGGEKTEVHLSLTSFHEIVINQGKGVEEGENTIWQPKEKDLTVETEMLYRLMVFLGGDTAESIEKIKLAAEENQISIKVDDGFNGYAKLVIKANLADSWDSIAWALDQKNILIEDKDVGAKAFYIFSTRTSEPGFFDKLFDEITIQKKYQLQLKSLDTKLTEVYFSDVSEENLEETRAYIYELFKALASVF